MASTAGVATGSFNTFPVLIFRNGLQRPFWLVTATRPAQAGLRHSVPTRSGSNPFLYLTSGFDMQEWITSFCFKGLL
jgi:hypothetical protein